MPDSNLEITAYRKPVVLYPLYAYQYFCPYTVSTVYCRIFFSLYILEICVNPFPPPEPGSFPIHSSSDLLRGHPESTLTSMSVLVVNLWSRWRCNSYRGGGSRKWLSEGERERASKLLYLLLLHCSFPFTLSFSFIFASMFSYSFT